MQSSFPEFYSPTPAEEERFVTTATVVIDANVLLGLYRMSSAQREKVLGVFESLKERLWIPYQVGLEYQRNRMGVIQEQASFYRKLQELHGVKTVDAYLETFKNLTLPPEVSREAEPLIEPLREKLERAARNYVKEIGKITERHIVTVEQGERNDPVRERLDALFEDRVGVRPEDKVYEQRVKDAQQRIANEVPPGYKDNKKDGDERKAGDYLLWAELLEHAEAGESEGLPTLLVTNDTKDDWYYRSAGKVTGPRPELVREFAKHSRNGYHQVTLEGLLRLANDHLAAGVDEATIEKASELSRASESTVEERSRRMFVTRGDGVRAINPEFADALNARAFQHLQTTERGKGLVTDFLEQYGDRPVPATRTTPETREFLEKLLRSQQSVDLDESAPARRVLSKLLDQEKDWLKTLDLDGDDTHER